MQVWEKVGFELKKEQTKGTSLLVSIWSTWTLNKSVLESLQTSDSFDESDDDSFENLKINIARPVVKLCSIEVIYEDWAWAKINKEEIIL